MESEADMELTNQIETYLSTLKGTLDSLNRDEISRFAEVLEDAYRRGATIFVCGNGGSASTASHFACDINKGVSYGLESRFKVLPLTDNLATIMAYANDTSYDLIFVEQLKNFIREGDVVVGISGSGNSRNVLLAIEHAKSQGNATVGLTGYAGGRLKAISDISVNANINDMQISEDVHFIICHLMMKLMCERISGKPPVCG